MTAAESPEYHRPVLADEVTDLLVTDPDGAYVDLTAGGGGHMQVIARRLSANGRLYGVDKDPDAAAEVDRVLRLAPPFKAIVTASYGEILAVAAQWKETAFAGALLDLGISSHQIDEARRGFSFRYDGPLDMRFDPTRGLTAADLVNTKSEAELEHILREFGEERRSGHIARALVRERQLQMILTTRHLSSIVLQQARPPHQTKTLARVFQALRIAVNDELSTLIDALPKILAVLAPKGRLVVITYHSLEDRIVKRFFQHQVKGNCVCPPDLPICVCGAQPTMVQVTRKAVTPSADEYENNSRPRSAKLRVGEKR